MKHSTAPWKRLDGKVLSNDGSVVICRVMTRVSKDGPRSVSEAESNASLIAFAPDLLAAVIRLVQAVSGPQVLLIEAVKDAKSLLKQIDY